MLTDSAVCYLDGELYYWMLWICHQNGVLLYARIFPETQDAKGGIDAHFATDKRWLYEMQDKGTDTATPRYPPAGCVSAQHSLLSTQCSATAYASIPTQTHITIAAAVTTTPTYQGSYSRTSAAVRGITATRSCLKLTAIASQ